MASTPLRSRAEDKGESLLAVPGKLVKIMIGRFSLAPGKDDPPAPLHSIAIGQHSIVATDRHRCAVIGEPESAYRTTDRRVAQLESERSSIYGDSYDAEHVLPNPELPDPYNTPPEGDYPKIGAILGKLDGMRYLASVDPAYLRDLAALALAANTKEVELYANEDATLVGFKLRHVNDDPSFGEAAEIPIAGIIAARQPKLPKSDSVSDSIRDAIEDMRPDADSGIESVTIEAGGKSVTLKKKRA